MHFRHKKLVASLAVLGCLQFSMQGAAYASITNKPISYSTESRQLFEVINQIQNSLGAPIYLKGNINPSMLVQGEFNGNNGYEFLAQLAKRLNLEWAATSNEAFLAPMGTKTSEVIQIGTPELATAVANKLNILYKTRGSNISVSASGKDITIVGLSWWIEAIRAEALGKDIDDTRKTMIQSLSGRAMSTYADSAPRDMLISPTRAGGLGLMVFKLKNAWSEDKIANVGGSSQTIPGVATLFSQLTGIPKIARASSTPIGPKLDASGTASVVPNLPNIAGGLAPLATIANNTAPKEEQNEKADQKKTEAIANQRSVIADPRQNAVIVRDTVEHYDSYKQLIKYMDQSSPMIQIDSYIVDLQINQATELGFGLSWTGGALGGPGGSNVNPGGAVTSPNVVLSQSAGIQLLSRISALEQRGLSQLVSVPTVIALNNLEAQFSTRTSFYVQVPGNQDAALASVTASTFLKVTPMFTHEAGDSENTRRIKLLLNIQDSTINSAPSALISNLPQVTENQIATQAVVNNGDTLVIGGQVVRKIIDNDSGFPFLSKLPIVGLLFGQRSRQYQEYLRIYVINPKILGDDSLQAATSSADQPSGTITNNRMLKDDLPRIIQGTGIPTSPNINLGPSQSEQNRQNSILKAIPMPGGPNN